MDRRGWCRRVCRHDVRCLQPRQVARDARADLQGGALPALLGRRHTHLQPPPQVRGLAVWRVLRPRRACSQTPPCCGFITVPGCPDAWQNVCLPWTFLHPAATSLRRRRLSSSSGSAWKAPAPAASCAAPATPPRQPAAARRARRTARAARAVRARMRKRRRRPTGERSSMWGAFAAPAWRCTMLCSTGGAACWHGSSASCEGSCGGAR